MEIVYIMLLIQAAELAAFHAFVLWRLLRPEVRGSGCTAAEETAGSDERKSRELEKAWQEGMSSMMGYDLAAARRAVRDDGSGEGGA